MDSEEELLAAAAEGAIDIVTTVPGEDPLKRLDEWAELGWILLECGCMVRIGGPFDPHGHT